MIEMDVREQHRAHIGERDAAAAELGLERGPGGRGAGIDERRAAPAVQEGRRDDLALAEKLEVKGLEAVSECQRPEVYW
jgi:hypothetical protein